VPLLAPVADKLGIDLIWFGVLLGVNMQTSFMHPPFGFALFYLRSVAPAAAFADRVTGRMIAPVTTGQIYWGAVPFVVIQLVMVGAVIAFPGLVTDGLRVKRPDAPTIEIPIDARSGDRRRPGMEGPPPEYLGGDDRSPATDGRDASVDPRAAERSSREEGEELERLFKSR
jgi:GntP family gluconate:H+ symporter